MIDSILNFLAHGLIHAGVGSLALYLLVVTQLTILSVTLYLHRSQAHRGVDFHPLVAHFFRFWAWLTTAMVTKQWVAVHRKHHAKVETEEDPHSPMVFGIKRVFWQGVELYRVAASDKATEEKYGRGTPDDWIERNLYARFPDAGPTLLALISIALFGFWGLAIWAIQMLWIPFWAAGFVNGLGHWWGYRNFESSDTSTNLSPWGLWIGGEELHNNHHAFPSSAKFALRRFEVDIGWVVIRLLAALRLARVLRVAPSLDVRPNVHLPDAETLRAVLTHRFHALTDYYRQVIVPTLKDEAALASERVRAVPAKLRRALADGGRWLDGEGRQRLQALLEHRPTLGTVVEYRARLLAALDQRVPEQALRNLQQWVHEAEASGIAVLQQYAARLKAYALPAAAG
ncbi:MULTISPECIES: fatty acid desaturase [Metallibacterium]|jgi:stearoyl-CoA desaturase (delta-9 desaturase)|uniref:DesA family fatty acid desaturase n=1 Tax=Metallibacterium TaxID=1218803 RepID=UPI00260B576B|nr:MULTISPECIES: fatty acid desaturase [Metallibacterium]MBW8075735.1 acyl-CoA desaturase [Metallibacterium scheffleri]